MLVESGRKANRLEFWKVNHESGLLELTDDKLVNGTIATLQRLRPRDSDTDLLLVATDKFQIFTVSWNPTQRAFITIDSFFDETEQHFRDSQSQDKILTDPSGRYMVWLLWEGVLNVLRMSPIKREKNKLQYREQVRISELFIKSACFLHNETGHPKLAFLYQTRTDVPDAHLVTYRLFNDDKHSEVSSFFARDQIDKMEIEDPGAAILIPVSKGDEDQKRYIYRNDRQARAHLPGLLVVGETRLLYYDDAARQKVESSLPEATIFVAWAQYDVAHYFIGDDYGHLWLLTLVLDGTMVTDLRMKKMESVRGETREVAFTSRANALAYMGDDLLFIGSHYGNSQVWKTNVTDGLIEQIQDLPNISPILDFNVMDMGNREGEEQITNQYSSGQARIVAGSGVFRDGSLRSVRSGVGLEDIGIMAEMGHVKSLFAVRSGLSPKDDTLIVSLLTCTRLFKFNQDGEVDEVDEFMSLTLDEPTLLAQNIANERLLQVTPLGVRLIDLKGGVEISRWSPPSGQTIIHASANGEWILLSVGGKDLLSLQIQQGLVQIEHNDLGDQDQVACIHLPSAYPNIGFVGFWKSGTISIVDVKTLQPIHGQPLRRQDDNTSVPRDIVLAQILPPSLSGPTLFVAMDDGFVVTFAVAKTDMSLSGRKSIVLGTRHARLQLLPRPDGTSNVFATSEMPSLIYGSEGRVVYSSVTVEDATCVCSFDTEAFPDSIVVATENLVKISAVDNKRSTHVRTLPQGQTVRRIAYSRSERVFGLGCIKREVVDNEEVITNTFRLVDEVIFDQVGRDFSLDGEVGTELVEAVIRAELPDSYGNRVERFIVGTNRVPEPSTKLDHQGRILVLGIDSDRNPYLVLEHKLKGACRCLGVIGDTIIAALSKTIVAYQYTESTSTSGSLQKLASYRPSTYPVDMAIEGDIIAVADLMKSMTLVQFTPKVDIEPARLQEIARHREAGWATAVSHIEGQSWLQSDSVGNVLVLTKNENGVTAEDKAELRMTSEINLGEMVNRVRKVTVDSSENAVVVPRAFLGTVRSPPQPLFSHHSAR
jgi:DNA damage-binding protein 1